MTSPSNLLTEWATLLLASLADAGVRDVVISPGSRSTPFVVAAVREPRLRCHVILDERAASFFALGQARVSASPTLLLCTSGTAGAHYFPAIIEAEMAFVPLLVLTADRPLELVGCAAPQTIDQTKLFGDHVRHALDLGMPDPCEAALRGLRRMALQAVALTMAPLPGPVHLNARARKPLEPVVAADEPARALASAVRRVAQTTTQVVTARPVVPTAALRAIARHCRTLERGVIVAGPGPLAQVHDREAVHALALATGYPIVPEATSQFRFTGIDAGDAVVLDTLEPLLKRPDFRERHGDVEVVIQIGRPPTSTAWDGIFARAPTRVVIAPWGWNDPHGTASHLVLGEVGPTTRALATIFAEERRDVRASEWSRGLVTANAHARRAVDAHLAIGALTEGYVARCVVDVAPRGSLLMLGNSLAVRLVDTFAPAATELGVLSQRGANGIDGNVAGAVGAAVAAEDRPTTLLLGDLSLLHDLGSLALVKSARRPFVVVVVQNRGGRIFEQLPIASAAGIETELLDATILPHTLEFAHAAAMFGVRYARIQDVPALRRELATAYARDGATLLEVIVPPHAAAAEQRELSAALAR